MAGPQFHPAQLQGGPAAAPRPEPRTTWPEMRCRIGADYAAIGDFNSWLADASPRDRFVYAVGEHLRSGQEEPVVVAARRAMNLGQLLFTQEVDTSRHGRKETRYLVVRKTTPAGADKAGGAR